MAERIVGRILIGTQFNGKSARCFVISVQNINAWVFSTAIHCIGAVQSSIQSGTQQQNVHSGHSLDSIYLSHLEFAPLPGRAGRSGQPGRSGRLRQRQKRAEAAQ